LNASRNVLQTVTLLDAIEEMKFDCAMGGGRRDERKPVLKSVFSRIRDEFGQWDPKNQRLNSGTCFAGQNIWRTFQGFSDQQLDRNGCLAIYFNGKHRNAQFIFYP